jgi:hypothetical protein
MGPSMKASNWKIALSDSLYSICLYPLALLAMLVNPKNDADESDYDTENSVHTSNGRARKPGASPVAGKVFARGLTELSAKQH